MSYFTETFGNILEFKGEAELAYAKRREHETGTHKHGEGAKSYKSGRSEINSNSHDAHGLNKDNYTLKTRTNTAKAQSHHYELDDRKDPIRHSINKHNTKNESFDPVYNNLVNMGIID